jgi:hypothetical protein
MVIMPNQNECGTKEICSRYFVAKEHCERHREVINSQLSDGKSMFARIETKVNIIMGILGTMGVMMGGVLVGIVFMT